MLQIMRHPFFILFQVQEEQAASIFVSPDKYGAKI